MMSLSLRWTCQKDGVSFLVKFGLNKNNFVLKKSNDMASSGEVNKKVNALVIHTHTHTHTFEHVLRGHSIFLGEG